MKTANVILKLSRDQTVVKTHITPAQAQMLVILHMANSGGEPVKVIEETEEIDREDRDEIARLRRVYGVARVKALFGPNSPLPATFEDAIANGQTYALDNPDMDSGPMVGRKMTAEESNAFVG